MHIRLIAVGDRQPAWVDDAFGNYSARFPREWKFRLDPLATARRGKNDRSGTAMSAEGKQILSRIDASEQVILLDERGRQLNSKGLSETLAGWQTDGRDICFVIGGPDGVSDACRKRADFTWALSTLTLPHGLARVLLAEQLYRAHSLQTGHPYHREYLDCPHHRNCISLRHRLGVGKFLPRWASTSMSCRSKSTRLQR